MPSILPADIVLDTMGARFKPCYKWNAFNTDLGSDATFTFNSSFKPCYKWNAFNTYYTVTYCLNIILF